MVSTRPSIASRVPVEVDAAAAEQMASIIIEASRASIERQGAIVGDQAKLLEIRAAFHDMLWNLDPDRKVTARELAALEMIDAAVFIFKAKPEQVFTAIAMVLGKLGALGTAFAPRKEESRSAETPAEAPPAPPAKPEPMAFSRSLGLASGGTTSPPSDDGKAA